jgi:hypothetical protein
MTAAEANQAARTKLPELADLVDEWCRGKLEDVTAIVSLAEERARKIPKVGEVRREVDGLQQVMAELLVRVASLETEVYGKDPFERLDDLGEAPYEPL